MPVRSRGSRAKEGYHKVQDRLAKVCRPESLVLSHGYDPSRSEGALIPPIFLSSTFVFPTAEEGKRFFEIAYNLRPRRRGEKLGLIYSRLNNPDLQIPEERLTLLEQGAEAGLLFASGMAAITTSFLALLAPGDAVVSTEPVYGGTDYLFRTILPKYRVKVRFVPSGVDRKELVRVLNELKASGSRPAAIFVETPANPTNVMTDIAGCVAAAREVGRGAQRPWVLVDNTFLGPLWQSPLRHHADLVLYSATKFIGGHSDLVSGAALGRRELIDRIAVYRTILGTMANPFDGFLVLRSLDTLTVRMKRQSETAKRVSRWLVRQPQVSRVLYPGLPEDAQQRRLARRQCRGPGSLISFEVRGGERGAFRFLNALELVKVAVSLGGTHTLAEHPASMTHSDVPREERERHGISESMVRLSIGLEDPGDLIRDLQGALRITSRLAHKH
ncbi:MAG: aminotransferase class I/II-fold pyridoxal phosphate-dependent enzyme [Euryarchaeota archaeon]|nr:aminotransferase class I/II-fold pyridoxal phosphate-dependent enzyme [Euryarchaeota archaeon]MDE2045632.1 aminotransferase class I/II-fold pyridoxal phosphate-dependent enzyme [Thermoplasmata archaeon]